MASYVDFMDEIIGEAPGCPYPVALDRCIRVVRDFCKRTYCYQADLDDVSIISGTKAYTIADPDDDNEVIALVSVANSDSPTIPFNDFTFDPPTLTLYDTPTSNWTMELRAALRPAKGATSYNVSASYDYTRSFTDDDLTAGVLTVEHDLNDQYVFVTVYNNNDMVVIPSDITATDANTVTIDLTGWGTISGTWHTNIFSGATSVSNITTSDAATVDDIIYYNYYDGIVSGTLAKLLMIPATPWHNLELARIHNSIYNSHIVKAKIDLNKQFTTRDLSVQKFNWV